MQARAAAALFLNIGDVHSYVRRTYIHFTCSLEIFVRMTYVYSFKIYSIDICSDIDSIICLSEGENSWRVQARAAAARVFNPVCVRTYIPPIYIAHTHPYCLYIQSDTICIVDIHLFLIYSYLTYTYSWYIDILNI